MKKVENPPTDVGVIVGRFQVHELHEAHINLIQSVCDVHGKVLIFLGLSPARVTRNNPLDFESRKQMILDKFPNVNVLYIKDTKSDVVWSKNIDQQIGDLVGPSQSVTLYGSRDSFISLYHGKYNTQELVQETYISGTEVRKNISKKVKNTPEFRAGVIWAAYNQFPKVFPTVDIAILNEEGDEVLLGRKPDEDQYRFIGGFAEPKSQNYEEDAQREVAEEAGDIEVSEMKYIGSYYIDDWRYSAEIDRIKTLFFACTHLFGKPTAGDDIAEVRWFKLKTLSDDVFVDNHKHLFQALKEYLKKQN